MLLYLVKHTVTSKSSFVSLNSQTLLTVIGYRKWSTLSVYGIGWVAGCGLELSVCGLGLVGLFVAIDT